MGTVYTLPVLSYPSMQPDGNVIVSSNKIANLSYGYSNSLVVCGTTEGRVGNGSNVPNTLSAWYKIENGRAYYLAINNTSSWIHTTVSMNSPSTGSVSWGYTVGVGVLHEGSNDMLNLSFNLDMYSSYDEARRALGVYDLYPITYSYTNSNVSGPSEAAIGDTVTVSAVPNVNYGITDPTTQIAVTNNDAPVSFTWDAATNRITFIMPDPS